MSIIINIIHIDFIIQIFCQMNSIIMKKTLFYHLFFNIKIQQNFNQKFYSYHIISYNLFLFSNSFNLSFLIILSISIVSFINIIIFQKKEIFQLIILNK